MKILKLIFKWVKNHNDISHDPIQEIILLKNDASEKGLFDKDEIYDLFLQQNLLILFGKVTGLDTALEKIRKIEPTDPQLRITANALLCLNVFELLGLKTDDFLKEVTNNLNLPDVENEKLPDNQIEDVVDSQETSTGVDLLSELQDIKALLLTSSEQNKRISYIGQWNHLCHFAWS